MELYHRCAETVSKFIKRPVVFVLGLTFLIRILVLYLLDYQTFSKDEDFFNLVPEFRTNFLKPLDTQGVIDRFGVIGGEDENSINLLAKLYEKWVPTKKGGRDFLFLEKVTTGNEGTSLL